MSQNKKWYVQMQEWNKRQTINFVNNCMSNNIIDVVDDKSKYHNLTHLSNTWINNSLKHKQEWYNPKKVAHL